VLYELENTPLPEVGLHTIILNSKNDLVAIIRTNCFISIWQSAYKGIVPDEYLSNMSEEIEQRAERHKNAFAEPGDCEYFCVLLPDNMMIGFITINKSYTEDSSCIGEIWAVYLAKEYWYGGVPLVQLKYVLNSA